MHRILVLTTFSVVCLFASTWLDEAFGANLEGKVMKVIREHQSDSSSNITVIDSGKFVVGPGVEVPGFGYHENPQLPALMDVDVTNNQIILTLLIDHPPAILDAVTFWDINLTIPSFIGRVSINPASTWQLVAFPDKEVILIDLNVNGVAGEQFILNIAPEPAGATLAAGALAAGVLFRRRRL
ncbi:MAG: hypothetical protein KF688_17360 [Pirellulales bacterium]|nr:hypothetical protein [Pirellulales bacterium]